MSIVDYIQRFMDRITQPYLPYIYLPYTPKLKDSVVGKNFMGVKIENIPTYITQHIHYLLSPGLKC